jgi:hypothetical protein
MNMRVQTKAVDTMASSTGMTNDGSSILLTISLIVSGAMPRYRSSSSIVFFLFCVRHPIVSMSVQVTNTMDVTASKTVRALTTESCCTAAHRHKLLAARLSMTLTRPRRAWKGRIAIQPPTMAPIGLGPCAGVSRRALAASHGPDRQLRTVPIPPTTTDLTTTRRTLVEI